MLFSRQSKVDLHVHSKYSNRPSEWFLRRIGAPECFVEPCELYEKARNAGMDFVTITDHNCIAGALEIAHLAGTFLSSEVTTYFPENDCKIHCLVWGIDEAQFRMISELRTNIFDLHAFLVESDIIHAIAHPLFRVNNRLTADQLEKLILMFKRFEGINGTREGRDAELSQALLSGLTPELIERLANKHDLAPTGPEPWVKYFTGGSDDHSGVYTAAASTVVPYAEDVDELLAHLRRGDHHPTGQPGGSLVLGHCLYEIAYGYHRANLLGQNNPNHKDGSLLGLLLEKLLAGEPAPRASDEGNTLGALITGMVSQYVKSRRLAQLSESERYLVTEFIELFASPHMLDRASGTVQHRRTFHTAAKLCHTLSYRFLRKVESSLREGRFLDSLQTASSLLPVGLSIAPYLAAFSTQHKDNAFQEEVIARFEHVQRFSRNRNPRKAWVTDTFNDVNGVCRTIKQLGGLAREKGLPLTVLTCLSDVPKETRCDLKNFEPVGTFRLPEYESQELSFPPFLDIIEYIDRHEITELIISTPGPLGLSALAAARLLGLRTVGIYHTDFPRYVATLTDDANMEDLTWHYMKWFYSQMDHILAPSHAYRNMLIDKDLAAEKISVMVRGVDRQLFTPTRRVEGFWQDRGLQTPFNFLYVGRVSSEKNIDVLLKAFEALVARGHDVGLAVVGDGPRLEGLRRRYQDGRVHFTGALLGEELATAYASADALVFPSTTDTFGNVVLEAQAAGVPVVVSNQGGPADIVRSLESGLIVDVSQTDHLVGAMEDLLTQDTLRERLAQRGEKNVGHYTWDRALDQLWHPGQSAVPAPNRFQAANDPVVPMR